jgi:thiamine-monophosphate kinase
MSEADFLDRYFRPLAAGYSGSYGLMDDAAVIEPPDGCDLVVTTDALIAGVHFIAEDDPADIAFKALAVNVSDLAAKAAKPIAYSLALALTKATRPDWLVGFARGLGEAQTAFGIALSGGDTAVSPNGPSMISITAFGSVPHGQMVLRGAAQAGDVLYVTGTIGDAALGLKLRQDDAAAASWTLADAQRQTLIQRYLRPQPRLALREALLAYASAAMDISDGLAIDCSRLSAASGVAARIDAGSVPLSEAARRLVSANPSLIETVLTGGDDYEILAAIAPDRCDGFMATAAVSGLTVTQIGIVENGTGLQILGCNGVSLNLSRLGYDHLA